jgi:hypothetical protein
MRLAMTRTKMRTKAKTQDESEGEDEDENNEQQDFGDRDEEAMVDDDILDEEGFAEL